jgi:DNA-binding transcriptional regulator YdaS (Cro superfamily)
MRRMELARYVKEKSVGIRELARGIKCSPSHASRLVAGLVQPSGRTIRAIQEFTKGAVQPNDFYPPDAA